MTEVHASVVCMHVGTGKRTGQPAALGFFGGFGGLADGLIEEVGIAEEARAPFGRAGSEGHTLQHWGRREGGQRENVISEVKGEQTFLGQLALVQPVDVHNSM